MRAETIPFEPEAVKGYLDECIRLWRRDYYLTTGHECGDAKRLARAADYIDAYQSVRTTLFGETLPLDA